MNEIYYLKYYMKTHFLIKYIPLFILICLSGNPLFTYQGYSKLLLTVYTAIFLIYCLGNISYKYIVINIRKVLIVVSLIVLLSFLQYFKFGIVSIPGIFALILKIILVWITYLYYDYNKCNFMIVYIKTLSFLTMLSFPFWINNQFFSFGIQLDNPFLKSTIFYTMFPLDSKESSFLVRNSGMFWEPGAFAGYIILALIFIVMTNKSFNYGRYRREFIVLSVGLLSSQSTTGYLVYSILIFAHFASNYNILKFIIGPIIIITFSYIYSNTMFLKEKIDSQFEDAVIQEKNELSNTRMGSLIMDWQYINSSPIIGNSLHEKNRWRFHPWIKEDIGNGNGMSNFIVWWGIPFFLFWLYRFYHLVKLRTGTIFISSILLCMILALMQGEQFLNFPIFMLFFILPLNYNRSIKEKRKEVIYNQY